jgi:predicted metal-dependent hydrolase
MKSYSIKKNRHLLSKKELVKKIHHILADSKRSIKKLSLEKLKTFVNNFIKLAFFVRDTQMENIDLLKLIPDKPYDDPHAKEVQKIN